MNRYRAFHPSLLAASAVAVSMMATIPARASNPSQPSATTSVESKPIVPDVGSRYVFPTTKRTGVWQCIPGPDCAPPLYRFQQVSADLTRLIPGKTFTANDATLALIAHAPA